VAALGAGIGPDAASAGSDPQDVRTIAGRAGASTSSAPLPEIPPPSPLPANARRRVGKRTTQAEIMVALPFAGVADADLPTYALLRHILGGFQERLYAEIREKRGFAYWVALRGFAMPEAGWFGVHTGTDKKNLPEVEEVIRAELGRIANEPVTAEELDRARRYLITSLARDEETNGGRAGSLVVALLDRRPFRGYRESVARLEAVTPERIQEVARGLLAGRHLAVVTLP